MACYYLHARGTCSGYLATCMITELCYLHVFAAVDVPLGRPGDWTCRQAGGQPDSRVDVRPGGHVHDMLLFARIWHLQWMPCDVHDHKTILLACIWQP